MPKMIVVPYAYDAEVRGFRKRNAVNTRLLDEVPVYINDIDPIDFPVAIRTNTSAFEGKETIEEFRFDGLNLYRAYRTDSKDAQPYSLEELEACLGRTDNPFSDVQGFRQLRMSALTKTQNADGDIVKHNRNDVRSMVQKRASELVSCEGQIWVRSYEPCYVMRQFQFVVVEVLNPEPDEKGKIGLYAPSEVIRADRIEDYLNVVFPYEDIRPTMYGSIEVIDSDALRMKSEEQALINCAGSLIEILSKRVSDTSVENFACYANLRDLVKTAQQEPTDEIVDAMKAVAAIPEWSGMAEWVQMKNRIDIWERVTGRKDNVASEKLRLG